MIFRDPIAIFSKRQLAVLFECTYSGEDRVNLTGVLVDFKNKRACVTDGHRLLLGGELPIGNLHARRSDRVCYVPREKIETALKLARPTSGIVIEQLDDELRISVVPKVLVKGRWSAEFRRDPEPFMEEEATEVVAIPKPRDPRDFPPLQHVTPKLDLTRKQAVGVAGFGAHYLATVASIARSIDSGLAGGATCRVLMPEKSPLDPVTFYLDDLTLGAWWVYVVMPHRT